jgi:hypothetical protein
MLLAYLSMDYLDEGAKDIKMRVASQPAQVSEPVMNALKALAEDRKSIFLQDILKALMITGAMFLVLFLYLRKQIKKQVWVFVAAIALVLIDLLPVDNTYLNKNGYGDDAYRDPEESQQELTAGKADQQILKDSGTYRVLNLAVSPFQDATTSYFHQSIGGYHAAKIGRYQDLWENKLTPEIDRFRSDTLAQMGLGFAQSAYTGLNMLNTKYIIGANPPQSTNERPLVVPNPNALGPCWFVREVKFAPNLKAEMNALNGLDASQVAIVPADQQSKNNPTGL